MRPANAPESLNKLQDKLLFRMSRSRGQRMWWFLPFAVVRRFRGHHAALLQRDVVSAWNAAQSPFFAELAVRPRHVTRQIAISRRYGRVEIADYDAIEALVEDLLTSAEAAPREPVAHFLRRQPLFGALGGQERRWILDRAAGSSLPRTGGHGDFHMFNFCKSETSYVLIDWEHFDAKGSFALDYIEFAMSHQCFSTSSGWVAFLGARRASEPAVMRMARLFDVDADVLWVLYLMNKFAALGERQGGFKALSEEKRTAYTAVLRAQVARMRPGPPGRAQAAMDRNAPGKQQPKPI